jgi:hypothetical protein
MHMQANAGGEWFWHLTELRDRPHPGSKISKAKHARHTRHGSGCLNPYRVQPCMGVRTTHEGGMQEPWQLDVVDIPTTAAQQPWIFPPRDRGPKIPRAHMYSLLQPYRARYA